MKEATKTQWAMPVRRISLGHARSEFDGKRPKDSLRSRETRPERPNRLAINVRRKPAVAEERVAFKPQELGAIFNPNY